VGVVDNTTNVNNTNLFLGIASLHFSFVRHVPTKTGWRTLSQLALLATKTTLFIQALNVLRLLFLKFFDCMALLGSVNFDSWCEIEINRKAPHITLPTHSASLLLSHSSSWIVYA
jgi:hypothetical protein